MYFDVLFLMYQRNNFIDQRKFPALFRYNCRSKRGKIAENQRNPFQIAPKIAPKKVGLPYILDNE